MLSKFSVKKPYTVIVAVVMVLLLGVISFTKTTTDLLPEMELPYVVVYTSYPGASAEKVENSVTRVLENTLGTTENLLNTSSVSSDNLSLVILEFSEDTNMDTVKIDLSTKLNQAEAFLEDGVGTPAMMAINPNMLPIMMATVDYDEKNLQELSDFTLAKIENELVKAKGVAQVSMNGILKETVEIHFNQDKIDEINNKILSNVNGELAKADKEINDGLKKINEGLDKLNKGQTELEEGKKETFDSLAQGSVMLNDAASQLISMNNHILELKASETSFKAIIDTLNPIIEKLYTEFNVDNIVNLEEKIITSINGLNDIIKFIEDNINNISDDNYLSVIERLNNSTYINNDIKNQLNNLLNKDGLNDILNNILNELKASVSKLNELRDGILKYKDASTRLEQLPIEIKTAEGVKDSAEALLKKAGIDTSDLNKLQVELESGKLLATNKITSGEIALSKTKIELESAKKELEKAKAELDKSKAEALKNANIDSLLNVDMLSNILTAENFNMPAGYLKSDSNLLVKVGEEFKNLDELNNLLLVSMDIEGLENIKLSDVAEAKIVNNGDKLYTKVNGNDAIIMSIQKMSDASTSEVSKSVKKTFDKLEEENPGLNFTALMDQGIYIDMVIDSVLENFVIGGILAVIILIVFLKSVKPTLIIALSIPISFMFAMVLMYFSGVSLNIISLSGLALGVGMLVDNSVVVVENIYRLKNEGKDIKEASIEGAKQVATAISASTLTTICVFLPIVFAEGLTKQLFTDMGLTIAYSLIASLVVALTLVPTLSSLILKKTEVKKDKFFDKLNDLYTKSLKWTLSHRALMIVLVLVLFIFSVMNVFNVGMELIPQMDSLQMEVDVTIAKEDHERRHEIYEDIMSKVKSLDGIEAVGVNESPSMMEQNEEDLNIPFYILAKDDADINELKKMIPDVLSDVKAKCELSTSQMDLSALGGSGISLKIYGDDLDSLKDGSKKVKETLENIDGIKEVSDGLEANTKELRIIIDKNEAMKHGLTIAQIYSNVASSLKNEVSSISLEMNHKDYPVVIIKDGINSLNDLYNLGLHTKKNDSESITLNDVATFKDDIAMNSIERENSRRFITVNATIEDGYNVALVTREARSIIDNNFLGNGLELEFDGENETIMEAMTSLIKMIVLAIAFIYMIMVAQFQSLKSPFIVMFTIPLAFTGGLIALYISDLNLSIVSMLGFLVLSGIVVNNGIVLIDYVNQLRESGVSNYDSLIIAGKTRLRPILMTALTTILAMTSMALGYGSGAQMMQGMAVVTIGGLSYATILTLYIVPILITFTDKKGK